MTTETVLDDYARYLHSWSAAETTIRARVTIARSRLEAWGWDGFTVDNVTTWLAAGKAGQPRPKWTVTTYYNHLTDFCQWAVAAGHLAASPMGEIRRSKRPHNLPRPLTDADVERVLAATTPPVSHWCMFALYAGLRAFEVAKLRGEDATESGLFVVGKGGVESLLPMRAELWPVVRSYPRHGYLWPGTDEGHIPANRLSVRVGRVFSDLGLDGSIHRLRHTYATGLLRSGVDVRQVQTLMRHSSLETTAGYLAVIPGELQAAVDALPSWGHPAA